MSFCLICKVRLHQLDICPACGGPQKVTDRHVRRAIRDLAKGGLHPVLVTQHVSHVVH